MYRAWSSFPGTSGTGVLERFYLFLDKFRLKKSLVFWDANPIAEILVIYQPIIPAKKYNWISIQVLVVEKVSGEDKKKTKPSVFLFTGRLQISFPIALSSSILCDITLHILTAAITKIYFWPLQETKRID